MLNIPGASPTKNVGPSRRDFLRAGSIAALGLSMPGLLRAETPQNLPRPDVSCILIWLQGGMSHIDSFDPKPHAPQEIRGEFSAIDTNVPGIQISEHLPKLAKMQDKFSIVRGLDPRNGTHGLSETYMLSGRPFDPALTFPSYGSVIASEKGGMNEQKPYRQLGDAMNTRFGGGKSGFLDKSHHPLVFDFPPSSLMKQAAEFEERFGRNSLGQGCSLAAKFTNMGSRFVTVTDGGWDTHQNSFPTLRNECLPRLDLALSTLLEHLSESGRLDSTLVMVLTDFGRTPKINARGGRDHCSTASVALLAGAGIRGGVVVGATDSRGEASIDKTYYPEDLAATIYNRMGVPSNTILLTPDTKSVPLINDGRLIRELL